MASSVTASSSRATTGGGGVIVTSPSHLPFDALRQCADFYDADGMYYSPRTVVEVDSSLLAATPFGVFKPAYEFVAGVMTSFGASVPENQKPKTALRFLEFMVRLNEVFVQDAAAMLVLHPERAAHPVFRLPCFRTDKFQVSARATMCFFTIFPVSPLNIL